MPNIVHKTADNKPLLVMHGDEFDPLIREWRSIGILGTRARDKIFGVSEWLNRNDEYWLVRQFSRNLLGLNEDFSLADYIDRYKSGADRALPNVSVESIKTRNELLARRAKTDPAWLGEPKLDGIIVGHNHIPDAKIINNVEYYNCGSWVKPSVGGTALVEHLTGRMELIRWDEHHGIMPLAPKSTNPSAPPRSAKEILAVN